MGAQLLIDIDDAEKRRHKRTAFLMNRKSLRPIVALCACGIAATGARAEEAHNPMPTVAPAAAPAAEPTAAAQETKPANPPAAAPAQDSRDEEIKVLRKQLEDINKRLEELEKAKKEEPAPTPQPTPPDRGPRGSATFLPNISAVGNLVFRAGDRGTIEGRGRSHFQEFEIAFQDDVAPGLRYDAFLVAAKEEEWGVGLEEGYVTATKLAKGLSARFGRIKTPVGKHNMLHPHSWLTVSQPSVITAFLGPEGMNADGAVLQYNLPVKGMFARAELGYWGTTSEAEDGLGFGGGNDGAASGRFWLGKALGRDRELELGFSRYQGRGDVGRVSGKMKALNGIDFTYKSYPKPYQRFMTTAEVFAHETGGIRGGNRTRLGGFLLAALRMNKYWEVGLRGDYTKFPYPLNGREIAGSLFVTKYLTEQTSLRLEYQYADSTFGRGSGVFLQLLFGSGPHTHSLR